MRTKNLFQTLFAATLAFGFASCSSDDESTPVVIPTAQVSFAEKALALTEDATAPLQVAVTLDEARTVATKVNFTVEGTAIEGINYEAIESKSITIAAGATEEIIEIDPIDYKMVEADKTIELTLLPGNDVEVVEAAASSVVTLSDSYIQPAGVPTISFASSSASINAYIAEEQVITLGLSQPALTDVELPVAFAGTAQLGVDFELEGLNSDQKLVIKAGLYNTSFTVKAINNNRADQDLYTLIGFEKPSTDEIAIQISRSSLNLGVVDPTVDMSTWFNDVTRYEYFHNSGSNHLNYIVGEDIYGAEFVREYWNSEDEKYSTLSGSNYWTWNATDENQWSERINRFQKQIGYNGIDIEEQERWEEEGGDFLGLFKFFSNEAKYGRGTITAPKGWLRFALSDAEATSGTVVIPAQTLTVYVESDGAWWDEYAEKKRIDEEDEEVTEKYYTWYAEANTNLGVLSKSAYIRPVSIEVERAEGTFDMGTSNIDIDVTITCDDQDFNLGDNPKYLISQDGNSYTMRLRYRLK